LHGRLAAVEAVTTSIGELKKSHATLSSDKAMLEMNHATMRDRVEAIEASVRDSADKHGKALENAHARLEHIHGRVTACERLNVAVDSLQKGHSALAEEKATLHAHHATLQERVDYLEKLLGDSADKHAKELDNLKVVHARHAEEVKGISAAQAQHATMEERLNYLEKQLGDSAGAHVQDIASAHAKIDQIHGRMAAFERAGTALTELKRAHTGLAAEKGMLETSHASLKERVSYLETVMGDSADKHSRALEEAKAKMDHLHSRLIACERHGTAVSDLQKEHDNHKRKHEALHASHKDRMDSLEAVLGDAASKHAKELELLKDAHAKLATETKTQHGRVHDHLTQEKEAREVRHASVQERLSYIEKVLGDSVEKHERHMQALEAQKAMHAKLANDVKSKDAGHAGLHERVEQSEKVVRETAERHAQEIAAAHAKLDQLHGKLSDERAAREAHAASIDNLKKAHAALAQEKSMRDTHHASIGERLEYLEKVLGESADRHAREVEAVKAPRTRSSSPTRGPGRGSMRPWRSDSGMSRARRMWRWHTMPR